MEEIRHLVEQNKFVIEVEGEQAMLHYHCFTSPTGEMTVDFDSTFVPTSFRGKGIAEKLVRTGLKWAKDNGYKMEASCWYAAKFIR